VSGTLLHRPQSLSLGRRWALATLSGCLNGAAFIYYGPLTLVANLPLLFAIRASSSTREAALLGAWVGFLGGIHIYGVLNYGWWIFWAFSLYTASQMTLYGAVVYRYWTDISLTFASSETSVREGSTRSRFFRTLWSIYALAVPCMIWTLTEWGRTVGPAALPASYVGCIADISWLNPLLSWASVCGGLGVSALIALVPSVLFGVLASLIDHTPRSLDERDELRLSAGLIMSVLVCLYLWGALSSSVSSEGDSIKIAGLQGGFSNAYYRAAQADPNLSVEIIDTYATLLKSAQEADVDLSVWGESAIRAPLLTTLKLQERLLPQTAAQNTVIGGLAHTDPDGRKFNLAISFAEGTLLGRYEKVKTVPGVEAHFTPGTSWSPIPTPHGLIGVLICFESIYPHAGRALTQAGARLIIVISNDAGFGYTPISHHMTNRAVVRAVENGRWLLRVGQAGVTTLIDPQGRARERLGLFRAGVLIGEARLRSTLTPYTRWGLLWLWLFVGGLGVPLVIAQRERHRFPKIDLEAPEEL
jgi:apolipoprotein N-acyltransferase